MISCTTWGCRRAATHGALFRHVTPNATAHPVYYYCDRHVSEQIPTALEVWRVA